MYRVVKRDGKLENFNPNKVLFRIKKLCNIDGEIPNVKPLKNVNYDRVAQSVISKIHDNISTSELDEVAADIVAPLGIEHPEYEELASRFLVSNFHKTTEQIFSGFDFSNQSLFLMTAQALFNNVRADGKMAPMISPHVLVFIENHAEQLEKMIDYSRDYSFKYHGFIKLCESYLLKCSIKRDGKIIMKNGVPERFVVERPQHMWMRVAIGIWLSEPTPHYRSQIDSFDFNENQSDSTPLSISDPTLSDSTLLNQKDQKNIDLFWMSKYNEYKSQNITLDENLFKRIKDTYEMLSQGFMTHATPTLFNAGTPTPQLSSCFLMTPANDSMISILDWFKDSGMISKWAGGIGSHIHHIRPTGSYIAGTGGYSNGIGRMLKVVNDLSIYIDQCFGEDTIVYTLNGPKRICEIVIGDSVITHDGTFKQVDAVRHYNHNGDILKITVGDESVYVTDTHPILSIFVPSGRLEESDPRIHTMFTQTFENAVNLTTDHFIPFPKITHIHDLPYTEDDCFMYGLMLCWGRIEPDMINMSISIPNDFQYDEYEHFIKNYLMLKTIPYKVFNTIQSIDISWTQHYMFPLTHSLFDTMCQTKLSENAKYFPKIHPSMLHLPDNKIKKILEVFDDMTIIHPESIKHEVEYLRMRLSQKLRKIKSIERVKYNGVLTDFDIDTNENYLTNIGIAHNGGQKRPGSHAIYLEPWHGDFIEFLNMKKPIGHPDRLAKSLFYAVWINDEFMRCVEREEYLKRRGNKNPKLWYLMDPTICPGLSDVYDNVLRTTWIEDTEIGNFLSDGEYSPSESNIENSSLDSGSKNSVGENSPTERKFPISDSDSGVEYSTPEKKFSISDFAFTALYRKYISRGMFMKQVSACEIWKQICELTEETGIPYKLHKDAFNRKSNQANIGTIKSSNLCCEIGEVSNGNETAVCNLASICLKKFISYSSLNVSSDSSPKVLSDSSSNLRLNLNQNLGSDLKYKPEGFEINTDLSEEECEKLNIPRRVWFDFEKLIEVVRITIRNLDRVIDQNFYPIESARNSNVKNRPVGLGVQGLADVFSALWLPFGSPEAIKLDFHIFECMYWAAMMESTQLAHELGPYERYVGSPAHAGKLAFDMWIDEHNKSDRSSSIGEWNVMVDKLIMDWDLVRERVRKYGLRNSLLIAPMPTASTSTIMGNSPCIEPHNAIIYKRTDKHGESYECVNQLMETLQARGLWNANIRDQILMSRTGSISEILTIPAVIRQVFRVAFDLSPKDIINHSLARGVFVDQSMSLNLFVADPSHSIITQMHFYAWKRGIKTACYYLRRIPPVSAKKIQLVKPLKTDEPEDGEICTMQDGCITCHS